MYILELPKVSEEDQGSYVCKIENTAGSETASAELEVFGKLFPLSDRLSRVLDYLSCQVISNED